MGLSGGRKRAKISHDPNNTHWSRSTENYGHRMLLSQGWQPGSTLGAQDSSYNKHLTQASKSHIRVVMRDDNLGLGAKRGSGQEAGECVGLDAFQAMLGRLNGKSEGTLKKEQDARDDLKRRNWVEKRGLVHFVYGGKLVGEDYEEEDEGAENKVKVEVKTEARVKEEVPSEDDTAANRKAKREKKKRKSEVKVEDEGVAETDSAVLANAEKTKSKKRKKRSHEEEEVTELQTSGERASASASANPASGSEDEDEDEDTRKARRKAEKAEKKERKRLKREAKAAKLAASSADDEEVVLGKTLPKAEREVKETPVPEPTSNVAASNATGRHMSVRSRYIAAKRRAVMDPQALKEILMVKV